MRRILAMTLVACCLAAGPSRADMADAFGNTIMSRYPDGGWVKHWFNPDGTYSALFSDGRRLRARWSVQGEKVCLTHIRPNLLIPRFCSPMHSVDVGQTWQSRDPLGRRVQNVLLAGGRE